MAHTFKRTGTLRAGYNPEQVDAFLARAKRAYSGDSSEDITEKTVRSCAFGWVRNGYDPYLVDAALDRLEAAFVQRRRAKIMDEHGEKRWLEETYAQAQTLYPRLLRPAGERFADASDTGYSKNEVDALLSKIAAYFDAEAELTSEDIRHATFSAARGAKAYDEAVVDVFLDRAVSVLLSVE
ncbi:DivIVA domain-containing protein [Trueperella sp. LYQ143]|uniref:DivIVA domain-containing protein n=1 Tax=unclassified Trueperella TaxID=2630174 RepID=UPI003983C864